VIAVFISVSIHDLKPGSQDTPTFYLKNIYQLLADSNVSRASTLASSVEPPPFSPPRSAIWVNSLWLLSLGFSLTCALLATSLQQWTRRYIQSTQSPRYRDSPHKRARIRAFFAGGINRLGFPRFVEVLPALLHLSLFLFFSGLLIFVFHINHTTFIPVASLMGILATVYYLTTVMPILRHDSPYYSPISLSIWHLFARFSYEAFSILTFITSSHYFKRGTWARFKERTEASHKRLSQSMGKSVQDTVSKLSEQLDGQVLRWIFDALREDHELEQFFNGIPHFCRSKVVTNPKQALAKLNNSELARGLATFLNHTWSPNSPSEKVEARRVMVCMKAIDALDRQHLPMDFLYELCKQGEDGVFLQSVQVGHSLKSWSRSTDTPTALFPRGIIAGVIAGAQKRDYRWEALVMDQLGISGAVLRGYLEYGDSVLLANWIYITRQWYRSHQLWWGPRALELIQPTISKFNIEGTLPELQHDFRALWNDIVSEAHNHGALRISRDILLPVRHAYVALHPNTDATAFDASSDNPTGILRLLLSSNSSAHPSPISEANVDTTSETSHPAATSLPSHGDPIPSHVGSTEPFATLPHPATAAATQGTHDIPSISPLATSGPIPAHIESKQSPSATSPNVATAAATQGTPGITYISPLATSEIVNPFFPDPQPSFPQSSSSHPWRLSRPPDSSIERPPSRSRLSKSTDSLSDL
jgi:Family of unknown function (DUF6535)